MISRLIFLVCNTTKAFPKIWFTTCPGWQIIPCACLLFQFPRPQCLCASCLSSFTSRSFSTDWADDPCASSNFMPPCSANAAAAANPFDPPTAVCVARCLCKMYVNLSQNLLPFHCLEKSSRSLCLSVYAVCVFPQTCLSVRVSPSPQRHNFPSLSLPARTLVKETRSAAAFLH